MAKRDGYLGNLIDRHNMLWNKFVWLENLSQKRRKGEPNRHLNGTTLNKYVNLHKKGTGWDYMIRGMDAQSIQALIQRRDVSFDMFFKYAKEKKEGKNPQKKESPPQFKRVKGEGSFTLKQTGWKLGDGSISIGNFSKGDIHTYRYFNSRPMEGKVKTITLRRDSLGDFWMHVVTDDTPSSMLPDTGRSAGFDFGSEHFFTDSHGKHWDAPKVYFKHLAGIRKLDKAIARCKKGSRNQKRLYEERARLYRTIADTRDDWQWKLAWEICKEYDVLCFENLDLADMGKRHKEKEKDLTPEEKKTLRKWRRKMRDYAPGAFMEKVKWIARKTGRTVLIDGSKWDPTTQKCHECGEKNPAVKDVRIKKWTCPHCHAHLDRDVNAAMNVETTCLAEQEKKGKKISKGPERGAGGASSVEVGSGGATKRESRWARIRKSSKSKGGDAGPRGGDPHDTQTHGDGLGEESHRLQPWEDVKGRSCSTPRQRSRGADRCVAGVPVLPLPRCPRSPKD